MNKLFSKLALESATKEIQKEVLNLQSSELVTTGKILIENNLMLLPSVPDGKLVWDLAIVYDDGNVAEIYPCEVEQIEDVFFAKLEDGANGLYGVVSYLSKVVT
jgi:hypothetical protein